LSFVKDGKEVMPVGGRCQKDEEWRGPFQKLVGEESLYSILGKGCLNLGRNH
jgi:hypothetical protein